MFKKSKIVFKNVSDKFKMILIVLLKIMQPMLSKVQEK